MSDQMHNPFEGAILESRMNSLDFTGVLLRLVKTKSDYDTFIAEEVEKFRTLEEDKFEDLIASLRSITQQDIIFVLGRLSNLNELEEGFGAVPEDFKNRPSDSRELERAQISQRVAQDLLSALSE